jgi:hypothetical protein
MSTPITPRIPATREDLGDLSTVPPTRRRISSQTELRKVLHRAGYSATQAATVLRDLPDPVDFDRDAQALLTRGVTLDRLINAVGGSP